MSDMSGLDEPGSQDRDDGIPADKYVVKISVTPETVIELLRSFELDVGDRPHIEPAAEGRGTLHAFAPQAQIRRLQAAGYIVEVGENASETGRQRMAEVPEGDRFQGGRTAPRGIGRKPGRNEGTGLGPEAGGQAK